MKGAFELSFNDFKTNFSRFALPTFRLLAWLGVFVTLISRYLTDKTLNPYFLFFGLPLVILGITGMIVCYFKK
jgi:hypothetical protein